MLLKYGNLMLLAGHILDLNCTQLSNAAPFCENYTKLYFKKQRRDWIGGGIVGTFSGKYRTMP